MDHIKVELLKLSFSCQNTFYWKMIDWRDLCFRWTSQRVLSWEPSLKQGFWVVRRKEWFIIYKNVQLFLQFWNSEIASRQKMNPFRVNSNSLAPRYFLHRLRELLSSSAFLFGYCSHWLLVSANQHWSTWQSRQKNWTKHVRSSWLPVSQIRFKFWLFLKTLDLKSYVFTVKY